jgi:hypothetical protein
MASKTGTFLVRDGLGNNARQDIAQGGSSLDGNDNLLLSVMDGNETHCHGECIKPGQTITGIVTHCSVWHVAREKS